MWGCGSECSNELVMTREPVEQSKRSSGRVQSSHAETRPASKTKLLSCHYARSQSLLEPW